jgi:glutathione S-transferase
MDAAARLVLYVDAFFISPYAFSSFVALREKGLPFETRVVALQDKAQHRPEFRDRSLTGRVPALDHDRFWLGESSAIDEYLEEAFPPPGHPPLYPRTARERARARQLQAWLRSDLMPVREERPTTTMFYARADRPLSSNGKAAAEKLIRVTDQLLPSGSTDLFGSWSIADSDLAYMLHRWLLTGDEVPARIRDYAEAQWRRSSVRDWVDRPRLPLVPYEG